MNGDEPTLERELADLRKQLDALAPRVQHARLRLDWYPGDFAFYGFAVNVWENAQGVRHLLEGGWVGAAYPCARGAVEAAQEALLLMAWADYNEAGARVVAFGRLELFQQRLAFMRHAQFDNAPPPHTYEELRQEVEAAAKSWDRLAAGNGDHLRRAYDYFQPKFEKAQSGGSHPRHWSEMTRRKMAQVIQARGTGDRSFGDHLITIYSALSRASHPGLRPETWERVAGPDGRPRLQISGRNKYVPATAGAMAVMILNQAFEDVDKLGAGSR